MTGLHVSAIYQQVLDVWRGDADYLSYLKSVVKMLPGGSEVAKVADQAIDLTEKARKVVGQVQKGVAVAKGAAAGIAAGDTGGVVQLAKDGGLFNAGSDFARSKLSRQIAFIKDQSELQQVQGLIADSPLAKSALPTL
jgi:hypothetical protein